MCFVCVLLIGVFKKKTRLLPMIYIMHSRNVFAVNVTSMMRWRRAPDVTHCGQLRRSCYDRRRPRLTRMRVRLPCGKKSYDAMVKNSEKMVVFGVFLFVW